MCGIFGLLLSPNSIRGEQIHHKNLIQKLFLLSESRGKEASGFACMTDEIHICKSPSPASTFTKTAHYQDTLEGLFKSSASRHRPFALFGHSRLVTHGDLSDNTNNHPIISDDVLALHNGIIVNHKAIWDEYVNSPKKHASIDTEALTALVNQDFHNGTSLQNSVLNIFDKIEGTASIALMTTTQQLALATNTGSLYFTTSMKGDSLVFASERYILRKALEKVKGTSFRTDRILQLSSKSGIFFPLKDYTRKDFTPVHAEDCHKNPPLLYSEESRVSIHDHSKDYSPKQARPERKTFNIRNVHKAVDIPTHLQLPQDAFDQVKRCTRCILPETMPYIRFDEDGVCNYCHEHTPIRTKGREALEIAVAPYRKTNGEPDCLIGLSGGRDSSFALHYFKQELGMNPIAFTYDWGLVTDLARRNQARLCGALGVEHIIVSADIDAKRNNIRKNINAWMQRPDLGIIPLFMAGDKHYYYYSNILQKQTGIDLEIYAGNEFEQTNFKTGFCGIRGRRKSDEDLFRFPLKNKLKLGWYYLSQFMKVPAYINTSLYDTIFAYYSRYLLKHNYLLIYDHIPWDEDMITQTLIDEYDWEIAGDTNSTWRIGDGTTSFYNYIYFTMAGLTENDTFRSKQVREGALTRDEALEIVRDENTPRYPSIKEYCDLIGVDFWKFLKVVNKHSLFPTHK